eukprot:NODE_51_length_31136_cov_0.357670.p14 type:complete len:272 gc:universal NODE_51_length_31136_cov_0.357670:2412-3227(+)
MDISFKLEQMEFNRALVRQLSKSFDQALQKEKVKINAVKAEQQHNNYTSVLKQYLEVTELPKLDDHPDACFVEDTCIVVKNRAVITNPGADSRKNEVTSAQHALQSLGFEIYVMPSHIKCDGGDVLYTGKNLYVGLSERTSPDAIKYLSDKLQVPAYGIKVEGALHLKSILGLVAPRTLSCHDSESGKKMVTEILSHEELNVVYTKTMILSNTLSFISRGELIVFVQVNEETNSFIEKISALFPKAKFEKVDMSELALADGALTCCSALLQ